MLSLAQERRRPLAQDGTSSPKQVVKLQAQQKPGVLLIGQFLSSLGKPGVSVDLAAQLANSGWSVCTTSHKTGRLARLIDMLTTTWKRRRDFTVANVEVYSGLAFVWAEVVCQLLRWLRKPYVLTLHGGNLPTFAKHSPGRVKRLLRSARIVTVPSRFLYDTLSIYRHDLILIPNPLDIGLYKFRVRVKTRPILIWLRAFHSIYNPSLAARVIAVLKKDYPDISLLMIGPDTEDGSFDELRRSASELGVINDIEIVGKIDKEEIPKWLDLGDIFINTTTADNTPVSVLEAMASGLCVVSTKVGGIPYLLQNGYDAMLTPPNDHEAMAKAITQILEQPDLAAQLSCNARKKAEQFDWSVVLPQWERTLSAFVEL